MKLFWKTKFFHHNDRQCLFKGVDAHYMYFKGLDAHYMYFDRHHITEELLRMAKNYKLEKLQTN